MIPALKAGEPGLKVLVYKNLSFTRLVRLRDGVDLQYQTTGVGYCDADRAPSRLVPDRPVRATGSTRSGYPQAWIMDVGNAAYQVEMGDQRARPMCTQAAGTASSWTTPTPTWAGTSNGRTMARYPTGAVLARGDPQHARDRRGRRSRGRAPRGAEPLRAVAIPPTTRRRRGATGSSSPPAPRRSTTRSGARRARAGSPAATGPTASSSRPSPSRQARSSRDHLRAEADTRSMVWARAELPALRRACERRRAHVRAE